MIARPPAPRQGQASWWALAVLFLTNVFNQGDRMLFGVVADPVKHDLALSDTQLGLANGLFFVLFNLVGGLFIARLLDRGHRIRILAAGMLVWSLATLATGLAMDYPTLVLARTLVGIGEATAFPAAMSLIPDLFRAEARGRAVSIYQSSNFVGIVGGTIVAGVLAAGFGWRSMFQICGAAGLVAALLLVATVREPLRAGQAGTLARSAYFADLVAGTRRVLSTPGLLALAASLGFAVMMGAVLGAWGAAFLLRSHHVPLASVGLAIGPPVGLGGIVGTILGGVLADGRTRRSGRSIDALAVSLVAIVIALPFMAGFVFVQSLGTALACAAVMNLALSAAIPPIMNYAINIVEPGDRGLAASIILAVMGVVGGAAGPVVVGGIADRLSGSYGPEALRLGLSSMLVTPIIATVLLILSQRQISRSS